MLIEYDKKMDGGMGSFSALSLQLIYDLHYFRIKSENKSI
jgi:hypothetical protein